MGQRTIQIHGITTKLIPFIFILVAFGYQSKFTSDIFLFFSPEDLFMGLAIIFAGLILLYEGIQARDDQNKSSSGAVGFIILMAFGILSLVFGILILFDIYQPIGDESDFGLLLTITLIVGLVIFGAGAVSEIIISRRFSFHKIMR